MNIQQNANLCCTVRNHKENLVYGFTQMWKFFGIHIEKKKKKKLHVTHVVIKFWKRLEILIIEKKIHITNL